MTVAETLAMGLAAAALLAALALLLRKRLLRRIARRLRRAPRLRYPLVLAHGLLGFRELRFAGARHEYFRGVSGRLRGLGAEVYAFGVSPTASVEARAPAFRRHRGDRRAEGQHRRAQHGRARRALRHREAGPGTQSGLAHHHRHSAPRNAARRSGVDILGERLGVLGLLERLGIPVDAFFDLTTSRMERFNQVVPDARGVSYGCVVGRHRGPVNALSAPLLPAYLFLTQRAGENDGLVPASSQEWGEVLKTIEADHWAQVGWSARFDAPELYAELVRELRGRGF